MGSWALMNVVHLLGIEGKKKKNNSKSFPVHVGNVSQAAALTQRRNFDLTIQCGCFTRFFFIFL